MVQGGPEKLKKLRSEDYYFFIRFNIFKYCLLLFIISHFVSHVLNASCRRVHTCVLSSHLSLLCALHVLFE